MKRERKSKGPKPVRAWAAPINGKINPLLIGDTRQRAQTFSNVQASELRLHFHREHVVGKPIRVTITPDPPRSRK